MEGPVAPGQLNSLRFELATTQHDAALRQLLRDNPIAGRISLSFEREPSFFGAASIEGPEHQTIVAVENQRVVCAGSISTRNRFINGHPMRVGYLGGLRLDSSCRHRISILRGGYDKFRELHEQGGPPIYLTSIVADNLPARRLLERGLKGMPTYRFLGEFVTLIITRRSQVFTVATQPIRRKLRARGWRVAYGDEHPRHLRDAVQLLHTELSKYQFAPVWDENELHIPDFRLITTQQDEPVACASIWDQRTIKQTVVRGYSSPLRWLRPLYNFGALSFSRPRLPAVGRAISSAYIAHLASDPSESSLAEWLILLLHGTARTRKIDYLTIGFDARDPRLERLRHAFKPREYVSRLYAVHWDDGADLVASLDDRLLAPEVALL
jgi:hypothetical protein